MGASSIELYLAQPFVQQRAQVDPSGVRDVMIDQPDELIFASIVPRPSDGAAKSTFIW